MTRENRRAVLPMDGSALAAAYLQAHPSFSYREDFVTLSFEAYESYVAGCPRASMITAGEALLRIVFDAIVRAISNGRSLKVRRGDDLSSNTSLDRLQGLGDKLADKLTDDLTFCGALTVAEQNDLFEPKIVNQMFEVKFLRDRAAHGTLPVLHDWDPDDPRPEHTRAAILWDRDLEWPEGYRFYRRKITKSGPPNEEESTIDLRQHGSVSLKTLGGEDRLAAIQQLLVWDLLRRIGTDGS